MCVCSFIHIHSLLIVPVMCMLFLFWNTRDCAFVHARAQLTFPDMHALVYSVTPDSVCVFVHAHGQLWYICALFLLCNCKDCVCMLIHACTRLTNSSRYMCVVFYSGTPETVILRRAACTALIMTVLVCVALPWSVTLNVLSYNLNSWPWDIVVCLYVQYITNILGSVYQAFSTSWTCRGQCIELSVHHEHVRVSVSSF